MQSSLKLCKLFQHLALLVTSKKLQGELLTRSQLLKKFKVEGKFSRSKAIFLMRLISLLC